MLTTKNQRLTENWQLATEEQMTDYFVYLIIIIIISYNI